MLRRLAIKNLAIVEDLQLELGDGLTVLTGETGAGKSILVDALLLLAGGRGSSDLVRQGAERLVVAGEFDVDGSVRGLLEEAGLPSSDRILVKRELSPEGRGRAFVEDEPAAIRTLARLGERLLTIHGQNSELELADRSAALELLDAFANAQAEVGAVAAAAAHWAEAREALEVLEESRRDRAHRLEVLDFEIREIEAVSLEEKEEEELLSDRARLAQADRVRRAGETALMALSEGEDSAGDRIGQAVRAFAELASIDPRESAHVVEAEDLKRRVADLAAAARDAAEAMEADPDRLTAIETRLEKISRLKRKYGPSFADVQSRLAASRKERSDLSNIEDALDQRRRQESQSREQYRAAASGAHSPHVVDVPTHVLDERRHRGFGPDDELGAEVLHGEAPVEIERARELLGLPLQVLRDRALEQSDGERALLWSRPRRRACRERRDPDRRDDEHRRKRVGVARPAPGSRGVSRARRRATR